MKNKTESIFKKNLESMGELARREFVRTGNKEDENKNPEKEYTPIRKFYAWFGFISILFCIGIFLYSLVWSINYINYDFATYEPHSPLLLRIEGLEALIAEQDTLILEQQTLIRDQDSVITEQLSLLNKQNSLINKYIDGL